MGITLRQWYNVPKRPGPNGAMMQKGEKQMILKLISLIIILTGTIFINDARTLSINWFSFGDQNEATSGLKILGFIIAMIGAIIFYIV